MVMDDDEFRAKLDEELAQHVPFHMARPSADLHNWLVVEVHSLDAPLFVGTEEEAYAVMKALNDRALREREERIAKFMYPRTHGG